jgi:DNA-binding MarR family transcriptional regulator
MSTPTPDDVSLVPVFRALMECHTQVTRVSGRHIEELGLTPSQFDVLAVLGDTPGMTCSELGRRTLISKGTLTPVLDRMEAKGWILRQRGEQDARQIRVSLTPAGDAEYRRTFMPHVDVVKGFVQGLPADKQTTLVALLNELKACFEPRA